jgi:hypothetical protein
MVDTSKVCDVKIRGIDWKDYPDFCDAFVAEAWLDLGNGQFRELTEAECEWLTNGDNSVWFYEQLIKAIY